MCYTIITNSTKGNKMKNQYLVTWQWDDAGDEGAIKVQSFDTYADAVGFLWQQKAGTIRVLTSEGNWSDSPEYWVSPNFTGLLAGSVTA